MTAYLDWKTAPWFYKLINAIFQDLYFPIRRMKWAKSLSTEVCFRTKFWFFFPLHMLGPPTECVHTLLQRLPWPSILCNQSSILCNSLQIVTHSVGAYRNTIHRGHSHIAVRMEKGYFAFFLSSELFVQNNAFTEFLWYRVCTRDLLCLQVKIMMILLAFNPILSRLQYHGARSI